MRKIEKGNEPDSLRKFKRAKSHLGYKGLEDVERRDIRKACAQEQYYLCAYCCQAISGENTDTMNEHVEAQDLAPNRTLEFGNIVASCTTQRQCDASHGSQPLSLTPLMAECETELRFRFSGRVEGKTPRAIQAIRVLNLGDTEANNKGLIEKRKQLVDSLILVNYGASEDLAIEEDPAIFELLLADLSAPVDGKLEQFSPVLINILRDLSAPR